MSGIKIHEYPDTATSLNDSDFYDADVFNGVGYDSKKVPGSVIKTDIINAAAVDSRFELTANKAVTMIGNSTSNIFYLSAKAVYDWATSLFVPYTRTVNGYNLGADVSLTTNDVADSLNKRYVTDANLVVIGNTSGTNTGDQDLSGLQVTLVSGTNIKTINGNTLLGSGDLVIGGGIAVGTTAVTSGTIGRVFFQGTGDVVQQSANLFWDNTNSRLGLGATPASTVRLDVRSQGALTTDIAFRIRNSANTKNLANITGLGDVYLGDGVTVTNQGTAPLIAIGSTTTVNGLFNSSPIAIGNNTTAIGNSIALGKGSSAGSTGVDNNIAIGYNALATGPSNTIVIGANVSGSTYAGNSIIVGHSMTTTSQARANIVFGRYMNSVQGFINEAFAFGSGVSDASRALLDVGDSFSIYINQNTRALFLNQKSNLVFRNGQSLTSATHFDANATNTFTIHNGTSPATTIANAGQLYVEAGALKFRGGSGTITTIAVA